MIFLKIRQVDNAIVYLNETNFRIWKASRVSRKTRLEYVTFASLMSRSRGWNPEDLVLPTAKKNGLFCFPFQPHSNNWSSHEIDTPWSPLLVTCLTSLISFKKFKKQAYRILKRKKKKIKIKKRNTTSIWHDPSFNLIRTDY